MAATVASANTTNRSVFILTTRNGDLVQFIASAHSHSRPALARASAAHEVFLLFHCLRIGIHAARPVTEQSPKTADDVRPLRRTVVALADVVAQVEE